MQLFQKYAVVTEHEDSPRQSQVSATGRYPA